MSINKAHAVIWLARQIGEADGDWSEEEIGAALAQGGLASIYKHGEDWADKVRSGELTDDSAIEYLNLLNASDRTEALVACVAVAFADGNMNDAEKERLASYFARLNASVEQVFAIYKARKFGV